MPLPRVADDVLLHEEADEAFLLHVASGRYYGLNPAGLVVWKALVTHEDPAAALHARWPDTDEQRCRQDTARVLAALARCGLVVGGPAPADA